MNIVNKLDAEIAASNKKAKPINVHLIKKDGHYEGVLAFKIEGDFVLNSKDLKDIPVQVEFKDGIVSLSIDSDIQNIQAFLSKDESSLLRAVKAQIKQDGFEYDPSFIVGPPGTGKTKVIIKILEEALLLNKKVLMLSPTNMAVENVFERIKQDELGLDTGDIVLTIKTKIDFLLKHSPSEIKKENRAPLEDELEIFELTRDEMLKTKRDSQSKNKNSKEFLESCETVFQNTKRDMSEIEKSLETEYENNKKLEKRISLLEGNGLLQSIASVITSSKVGELKSEKAATSGKIKTLEIKKKEVSSKLEKAKSDTKKASLVFRDVSKKIEEAEEAIGMINEKISSLKKKIKELEDEDVFKSAKIVGATLVNAALNQKIQQGEFDLILVDEASMALIPLLVVATQSLNSKANAFLKYKDDSSLYEAQNKAVKMALNSKIVFVGDPKQLQPIAVTNEMKASVFEAYGVERIFERESVKNTVFLDINFRNHPQITAMASKLFYGGMLKSGKEDNGRKALFVRKSTSKMVSTEGSYMNYGNIQIVVSQTKKALEKGRRSIGVVTPYRVQF